LVALCFQIIGIFCWLLYKSSGRKIDKKWIDGRANFSMEIFMKLFILSLFILSFSLQAQASDYRKSCSNADGTIRIVGRGSLRLTERTWSNGSAIDNEVMDTNGEWKTEIVSETVFEETTNSGNPGIVVSTTTTVLKIRVTNRAGIPFSENIVKVSEDLKSVEENVICEEVVTSCLGC
jgi:hypothetical protein